MFRISAFILYIFVSVSPFEWRIYTIDGCWNRQLIPLTHAQNAHVSLPSAVVCAVCSCATFWSDDADARRQQHRRLWSPLVLWSRLGVSRPLDIIMKIWPIITLIMTILFSTCCPNSSTLICKLDTVYRYTVFNGKTSLWTFFTHILHKTKWYFKSFCYIFYKIVENHP